MKALFVSTTEKGKKMDCDDCEGEGGFFGECAYCEGTGVLEDDTQCDNCDGTGEEIVACEKCYGTGELEGEE